MGALRGRILGRRAHTRDFGEAIPARCARCDASTVLHLTRRREWTTVFGVPLVPRESDHELVCPDCDQSRRITKESFRRARAVSRQLSRLQEGVISQGEFEASLREFEAAVGFRPAGSDEVTPSDAFDEPEL